MALKFRPPQFEKLRKARYLLYRRRFLQINAYLASIFEIYKTFLWIYKTCQFHRHSSIGHVYFVKGVGYFIFWNVRNCCVSIFLNTSFFAPSLIQIHLNFKKRRVAVTSPKPCRISLKHCRVDHFPACGGSR